MNELQVFDNEQFGKIRTVLQDGEPWFVAKDVCDCLDIRNNRDALSRLDDDEKNTVVLTDGTPGNPEKSIVNEYGLYNLVLSSRKPEAKEFKRWITHEVIPAIRKTGMFMTNGAIEKVLGDPDAFIRILTEYKKVKQTNAELLLKTAQQEQTIGELKPKADYTDLILKNRSIMPITAIAKDYGMSGKTFNKLLHEKRIQYKIGEQWFLYAEHQAKGYTHSKTVDIVRSDGRPDVTVQTQWTQKGRLFLYNALKADGIIPVIERG